MSVRTIKPEVDIKIKNVYLSLDRYNQFVEKCLKPMNDFLDIEFINVNITISHYPIQEDGFKTK